MHAHTDLVMKKMCECGNKSGLYDIISRANFYIPSIECGMIVMCCMQCCNVRISCFVMCGLVEVYTCLQ